MLRYLRIFETLYAVTSLTINVPYLVICCRINLYFRFRRSSNDSAASADGIDIKAANELPKHFSELCVEERVDDRVEGGIKVSQPRSRHEQSHGGH